MRLLALAFASFLLACAVPPAASGGVYEHLALSAGSPGSDGWTPSVHTSGGFVSTAQSDGALTAGFFVRPSFAPGEAADWAYAAPDGTSVASWSLERFVGGVGAGDWNTFFSAEAEGRVWHVAYDVPSVDRGWSRVAAGGLGASRLVARLVCGGPRPCQRGGSATVLALRDLHVGLHDHHAPQVTAAGGDLRDAAVLAGTAQVSFAASDRGSGVYRAWLVVDGHAQPAVVADADGGRCRDVVPGGTFQSAFRVPCPEAAGATLALDTQVLADGPHTVALVVEDAAGNRTTAFGPATRTVANRPAPPPRPPAGPPPAPVAPAVPGARPARPLLVEAWLEHRGRRTRRATVPYGRRVRIRGRVADAEGRPLARTPLAVFERVAGSRWTEVTGLRSRAAGRFTAFTRVGPSRRLRVAASGPVLRLRVRAPLSVRVGRHGRVRGRLRGGHVPPGGALVELQARRAGRWLTLRVVRTRPGGRFAGRLRELPPGPARVRARAPRQPGLPFAPGSAVSPPRTGGRTAARTSR